MAESCNRQQKNNKMYGYQSLHKTSPNHMSWCGLYGVLEEEINPKYILHLFYLLMYTFYLYCLWKSIHIGFITSNTKDRILQPYLDQVTLDLSKGKFFTYVFLGLYIHKTKVRNVQFHHFSLEIEEILETYVRNDLTIVEYSPCSGVFYFEMFKDSHSLV